MSESQEHVDRIAYTDSEIFEEELRKVFAKSWLYVAHESEIENNGDYVTRKMGRDPVIVTRDEAGGVRVLLNSCMHRGTKLCSADLGNTSHFRCSYHGWTYRNNGDLRGVPQRAQMYGRDFDPSKNNLVQARVDTFHGLIFATWDSDGPSLRESLGDAAWYLESAVGKADMEVVGPPGRLHTHVNWKIGAENYGGDGYHVPTTHKASMDLGVYGPQHMAAHPDTARHLGTPIDDQDAFLYHAFTVDEGHTGLVLHLPMVFEKPTFLGYEENMWDEFEERLSPQQVELQSGLNMMVGNIFPNLSWIEYITIYSGDDTPPTKTLHLRIWQPISPTECELLVWALVPRSASPEWKLWSQRAFVRVLGFSGNFETDDYQNWKSIVEAQEGSVAQSLRMDYSGGAHVDQASVVPDPGAGWAGNVYTATSSEVTMRAMYRRWAELMDAES